MDSQGADASAPCAGNDEKVDSRLRGNDGFQVAMRPLGAA